MKIKFLQMFFLGCLVVTSGILSSCASRPDVRSEYDKTVDFSMYKTFAFFDPLGTDRAHYKSIVSQYLKAATRRKLEARGLRYEAASPQLLINFNAKLTEKLRIDSGPDVSMGLGYYGYRGRFYSSWPMYTNQATYYDEGTLNIDLVDATRHQMIWEAVVVGDVTRDKLDNLETTINNAVMAAFAKYPVGTAMMAK